MSRLFPYALAAVLVGCGGLGTPATSFVEAVGDLDTDFQVNLGDSIFGDFSGSVDTIALNSDGSKIYLGGRFVRFGVDYSLVRINSDGTFDETFPYESTFNDSVTSVAVDADDNVWVAGSFTDLSGNTNTGLVKLLRLLDLEDTQVTANLGSGFKSSGAAATLSKVKILSTGDIVVAGNFTTFAGANVNGLAKITSQGVPVTSFNSAFSTGFSGGSVDEIAEGSESTLYLGGSFTQFNGDAQNRLISVDSVTGLEKGTFSTNMGSGFNNLVKALLFDSEEMLWVGGNFDSYSGSSSNQIVTLSSAGVQNITSLDKIELTDSWTGQIKVFTMQPNNNVLVGGDLEVAANTTLTGGALVRVIRETGDLDTAFLTKLGTGFVGGSVRAIAVDPDTGKIYAGGNFTTFNGQNVPGLIRLK